MSLADEIRAFTYNSIIVPHMSQHEVASFTAWDVHQAMHLQDRVPAVCAALDTKIFEDEYGLTLLETLGRPVSSRTRFIFSRRDAQQDRSRTSDEHRNRLKWFEENAGTVVMWPAFSSPEFRLASLPKGIYRPAGWKYALSIKIMLDSRYDDRNLDGVGSAKRFRYNQEEPKGVDPATYFTNLGLRNCLIDKVPVGIIRQVSAGGSPRYEVVGLGRIVDWQGGHFTVDIADGPLGEPTSTEFTDDEPISLDDARQRTLRSIVSRRGQASFRQAVMAAYGGKCAISSCSVPEVLEAAHIKPYLGSHTNVVSNGLLLRADLHTLFDLNLIRIEPSSLRIEIDKRLKGTLYEDYDGKLLRAPAESAARPALDALLYAWEVKVREMP